ncbi:MAG TPA: histidine phosphatase family protein [Streptosporangiaceae bacterium]|nr:histidine phosphatase family protein [Streptosporangiaceae bacterium]
MSEKTIVHLLRHGEVYNPEGVLYGRLPDFHLSETGELMAKAAADWFAGRDVTALLSSPLDRARETAKPLAETLGLVPVLDDRLLEATNRFEGQKFGHGDAALTNPRIWPLFVNPFKPSWGEPYQEIARRMIAAVVTARDAARGHEAVCVSHQLPIWTARRRAERMRLWHNPVNRQCRLASVTSLVFTGDRIVGVEYAEPAAHLYT